MGSLTKMEEELVVGEGWSKEAILYVNGVRRVLPDGFAHLTLLQYLRDIGLTGTKLGCGEGGCGACTVMASCYDQHMKKTMHFAINACLATLYSVEGMHIITVEGIGNRQRGLHPIQTSKTSAVLDLKSCYPEAKLVVGNTEVGIETKFKNVQYQVLICVTHVVELNALNVGEDGIEIGASVRLTQLQQVLQKVVAERNGHEISSCRAILEQLKWFAGKQIRNVASVGGNICTASPISDLNPLWMASNAKFQLIDCKGKVRTVSAKDYFLGYRKVDIRHDEILLSIFLPWTRPFEFVKEFKQAHRREDDIALVNAGMRAHIREENGDWIIADVSIVYGGVAALSLSSSRTEKYLMGKKWDKKLLEDVLNVLKEDINIPEDAPGGMAEFRKSLTLSFFFKFFMWVTHEMNVKGHFKEGLHATQLSAVQPYSRPSSCGSQSYELARHGTAVGLPMVHLSSKLQVTGEAEYTDDTPTSQNTLHAALILSRRAHARILSIDDSRARSSPGFSGLFLAKDVPGSNKLGPVVANEELFASEIVTCVGQVIGIVVADTHENAKAAANKVEIKYEDLPAILSIRDAVDSGSFHPNTARSLVNGDAEWCFKSGSCDKIIEGEVQVGGQEHFYLEPQSCLVWTVDSGNEVHMISSTQAPQRNQEYVANVLDLPLSKVVCKTKRIGGGFGGKETRSSFIAAAASVASYHLRTPVKIVLDRDVDMMITGQRHSFLGKYKVGFTNEGKVMALDLEIYNNGGNSLDVSVPVLERAMFNSENVYDIPHIKIRGQVCFTNFPSNTAFRGFGSPQGMLITENWIQRIATELRKSPEEIRELNFHNEGAVLHYGQVLENCTIRQVWDELKISCDFQNAREAVSSFNRQNRWRKRGVAMVPTKFGISFTAKHMNQAGALVQVYTDGTVLVTHGGVEMGQGLHTKVAQIAASSFNIPLSSVFISETSTDKVPNASATAASASSDMYGAAVLDACEQIKARMEPIACRQKHSSFAELVCACYMERIDLSAHGFYITPNVGFDWKVGKGTLFSYYTYGAAFAEVEIDTLTGDFYTRTADIVMDLGYSLNPAIDIGQIEGAFIQGLGWVALEELKWGDAHHKWIRPGNLFTCGPGTYKIPSINDIPLKFKVSLLKGVPNPKAIHSSKAVGEPPFFLASSVFFAIKDAIIAARAEEGLNDWFPLDNPATPERIRMACVDSFTKHFASPNNRPKLSV
uniref:Xanthine dehydrogenase n=1 Tax=Ananas comosus var. bracteatus TaxID=296719 RepID=A0A6V7PNW7_ANACO|nr:unnamed protein product [Ananas comosus var. bracteatus]